jgi:hypothetical protein
LGLQGHVGDGLAEVVERELRVLPFGTLDVAVRQVGDQQAGTRRPGRGATGQVCDETLMDRVPTPALRGGAALMYEQHLGDKSRRACVLVGTEGSHRNGRHPVA